jgi:superfamily II DNA or RNA helicase
VNTSARPKDYASWTREKQDAYYRANVVGLGATPERSSQTPTHYVPAYTKGLKILDAEELLRAEFPARSLLLEPWLPRKGLGMVYAPRGVGKTWIALSIAHALACGGEFLCWRAPPLVASFTSTARCPQPLSRSATPA